MKFCSCCSAPVTLRVPTGDNRERHVCDACGIVHYQNPKVVAGCVAGWRNQVLLCRRAIEPRYGLWTLPAGFMENGESTAQAAAREALEEANAVIDNLTLYAVYSLSHINQVYMMFRGDLRDGQASVGEESLDVALFHERDVPWQELAFPVVEETLLRYFEEHKRGRFNLHNAAIIRQPDGSIRFQRDRPLPLAEHNALTDG